jgi:nicotinate-nucleotide adenylyltransferase
MGGTFDPVHVGHLVAASEVAAEFALDEVVFVPTGAPWQKAGVTAGEHRYLMTVVATAPDIRFRVSRVDIDRPGPTYTVDTLRDLRAAYGSGSELHFITGADAVAALRTWHHYEEVTAMARVVAVSRPGHELDTRAVPPASLRTITIPALSISSTDIRDRVRAGRPIDYLVPAGVAAYIAKHGLYRDRP